MALLGLFGMLGALVVGAGFALFDLWVETLFRLVVLPTERELCLL